MAFELKFDRNINNDGELVFTDITGVYNVTENPTGYGTPNVERSDVNLVMYTVYGFTELINPVTYVPDIATEIIVPTDSDGIYETSIYALPIDYDYSTATKQELIDNSVGSVDFTYPFLSEINAVRRMADLVETYRDYKNCSRPELYEDLIEDIEIQLFGAEEDFCSQLYSAAHETMVELTKKLKATNL